MLFFAENDTFSFLLMKIIVSGYQYHKVKIAHIRSGRGTFKKHVTQKRPIFGDLPTYQTIDLLVACLSSERA